MFVNLLQTSHSSLLYTASFRCESLLHTGSDLTRIMVSTRHSGEGTGPPAASTRRHTASTEVAGRVPRELEIDMKDTSRDTKTPESNTAKRTYKHRGYTYEIDENTKPEWIDADPRNRRRLESAETQDTSSRKRRRVDQQTASSPLRPATGKRKRAASTEPSPKRPVFKQEESQDRQIGTPRKSARQPRVEDRSKPIPWADMITSEIRMKIVKFMALQRQIRKTQQEYDFYCGVAGKVTDGDDFGTGDDSESTPTPLSIERSDEQ